MCVLQCYELVSSGPHVLFGAEPAHSGAVMRSPGADFYPQGGSPCLLIFNLAPDLRFSLGFMTPRYCAVEVTPVQKQLPVTTRLTLI